MDMVTADMPFDYLYVHTFAYLPDQLSQPPPNILVEYRLAVLRDPHNVILDVIYAMRRLAVLLHGTVRVGWRLPKL